MTAVPVEVSSNNVDFTASGVNFYYSTFYPFVESVHA